jgi:hypothetical protein
MDLENTTSSNALFLNTAMGEDELLGCVIARTLFEIEGEALVAIPDAQWPISGEPMETRCGTFPGDTPFLTGGVDVFVVGSAWAPHGEPVDGLRVEIRVGERFERAIQVWGDRTWIPVGGGLKASDPEPFVSMPLTWERAFGGKATHEDGELPYPSNPEGIGYFLSPDEARGGPLPNLEDPDAPINSFEDHPDPVGAAPYPKEWALTGLNATELDLEDEANQRMTRLKPLIFNAAHPRMIVPPADAPSAGDLVEVTHVTPDGPLRFAVPDLSFHVQVQLEDRHYRFPLHCDQIGIIAEERRVFLSHRVVYRYRMVRRERRITTLHED